MIHLPILLIHGFNGQPANWTDPQDRFPEFLAANDYDPELIRLFSYGFVESAAGPVYNATGDMRTIAHRLSEDTSSDPETYRAAVDRLSRDSVARGGPSKITIIAHSSGGLIARYYLSCQTEDEFQTCYKGNVARVIMLGTPHLGVDIEDALDPLPPQVVFAILSRMHPAFPKADMDDIQEMNQSVQTQHDAADKPSTVESDKMAAFRQIHPKSDFLRDLNRPGAMPQDISYFNIAGDIRVHAEVDVFDHPLFSKEAGLGDMLVSTDSACTIPNAVSTCDHIVAEYQLGKGTFDPDKEKPAPMHRRLRAHPDSKQKILEILRRST